MTTKIEKSELANPEKNAIDAYRKIIKLLAELINLPQTDEQFNNELLSRNAVMEKVTSIRYHAHVLFKSAHPAMIAARKLPPLPKELARFAQTQALHCELNDIVEIYGKDCRAAALEDAARFTESSYFYHDTGPHMLFAKQVAPKIRGLI